MTFEGINFNSGKGIEGFSYSKKPVDEKQAQPKVDINFNADKEIADKSELLLEKSAYDGLVTFSTIKAQQGINPVDQDLEVCQVPTTKSDIAARMEEMFASNPFGQELDMAFADAAPPSVLLAKAQNVDPAVKADTAARVNMITQDDLLMNALQDIWG